MFNVHTSFDDIADDATFQLALLQHTCVPAYLCKIFLYVNTSFGEKDSL